MRRCFFQYLQRSYPQPAIQHTKSSELSTTGLTGSNKPQLDNLCSHGPSVLMQRLFFPFLELSHSRGICLFPFLCVVSFCKSFRNFGRPHHVPRTPPSCGFSNSFSHFTLHFRTHICLRIGFSRLPVLSQAFLDNRKSHEAKELERPHTTAALLTLCGVSSIAVNQVRKATVIGPACASSDRE
jgi:hypothetical protein